MLMCLTSQIGNVKEKKAAIVTSIEKRRKKTKDGIEDENEGTFFTSKTKMIFHIQFSLFLI